MFADSHDGQYGFLVSVAFGNLEYIYPDKLPVCLKVQTQDFKSILSARVI